MTNAKRTTAGACPLPALDIDAVSLYNNSDYVLFIHYCAVRRALPWRTCRNLLFLLKINTAMSCCRWSWRLATISPSGWPPTCRTACAISWCRAPISTCPGSASTSSCRPCTCSFCSSIIFIHGACSSGRSFRESLNPSSTP